MRSRAHVLNIWNKMEIYIDVDMEEDYNEFMNLLGRGCGKSQCRKAIYL